MNSDQLCRIKCISIPLNADDTYHYLLNKVNVVAESICCIHKFSGRILRLPDSPTSMYEELNYKVYMYMVIVAVHVRVHWATTTFSIGCS